jgi:hypothetical protein
VTVGDRDCPIVINSTNTVGNTARCTLPAGFGSNLLVAPTSQGLTTVNAKPLVSYMLPVVQSVSGCLPKANSTIDIASCPRSGGNIVTVTGTDFGIAEAKVLVGNRLATNVIHNQTHPSRQLTVCACVAPWFSPIDSAHVLVIDALVVYF